MSGANITTLIPLLARLPTSLSNLLDFCSLNLFVDLFTAIKPSLPWYQDLPNLGAPPTLSPDLQQFFAAALGIPPQSFPPLWAVLGDWLWRTCSLRSGEVGLSKEVSEAFRQHGVQRDISKYVYITEFYVHNLLHCNPNQLHIISAPRVVRAFIRSATIPPGAKRVPREFLAGLALCVPSTSHVSMDPCPLNPIL